MENAEPTIVIRRVKKVSGGAHGGAWKIALADFALALMAFFLVLWLIESTTNLEKMAIAGYFSDPTSIGTIGDGGTPYVLDLQGRPQNIADPDQNVVLVRDDSEPEPTAEEGLEFAEPQRAEEMRVLEELKVALEESINSEELFAPLRDSIELKIVGNGLSIQILDQEMRPLFASADADLQPYALEILWALGEIFATVPNRISIFGHTDNASFGEFADYTNWELSSERANAARRAVVAGGVDPDQIAQIIGMGASVPFDEEDPMSPANRRISIMILNEVAEEKLAERAAEARAPGGAPLVQQPVEPLEIF